MSIKTRPISLKPGLVAADVTFEYCKTTADASVVVAQGTTLFAAGGILLPLGSDDYLIGLNITEDTAFRVYVAASPEFWDADVWSLSDGDVALNSTVAKAADLATVASYIDTEITAIIDAIAALQADMGDPSGAGTTLQTEIATLLARLTSTRAALLDNLDGKVSDRPTAAQIAALFNAGTPATPVVFTSGRRIVVARGDKHDWPFNHGARYDCTGGKRVIFYWKEKLTDTALAGSVECTLTDALNVAGVVPFTPLLLPAAFEGYYEYKRYDADGTSNPLTIEQGKFIIAETVKH
ncbi:MAG: hypothetical protein OEW15_18930 [Nitrospirota bacterium]|nr:hypothetical protein [Nitrospirota bacterium]